MRTGKALTFAAPGGRVTVEQTTIVALVELAEGTLVVTRYGSHRVTDNHDFVLDRVWPALSDPPEPV